MSEHYHVTQSPYADTPTARFVAGILPDKDTTGFETRGEAEEYAVFIAGEAASAKEAKARKEKSDDKLWQLWLNIYGERVQVDCIKVIPCNLDDCKLVPEGCWQPAGVHVAGGLVHRPPQSRI
jgi:hypothetical protein